MFAFPLTSMQKVDTNTDRKILQARFGVAAAGCADPINQGLHRSLRAVGPVPIGGIGAENTQRARRGPIAFS